MRRYRERRKEQFRDFTLEFISPPHTFPIEYGLRRKDMEIERMHDKHGLWPQFCTVNHRRTWQAGIGAPSDIVSPYGEVLKRPFWINNLEPPSLASVSASDLNDFAWKAYLNATTQVPEKISLPNFLLELGDLKEVFLTWKGSILRLIAEGNLSWQLAIKPLLSDIKKIKGLVEAAKKRLRWLRKTLRKPTTVHYMDSLKSDHQEVEMSDYVPQPLRQHDWALADMERITSLYPASKRQSVKAFAHIVVYHDLQGLDSAFALLDVLGAMSGGQNPLKVAWNALPLSFILEYVISLEHLLDQCQLATFSGEIRVLDAGFGLKSEASLDVYSYTVVFVPFDVETDEGIITEYYGQIIPKKVGSLRCKEYTRRKGLPLGSSVFLKDGLTNTQMGIVASLFYLFLHGD